MEEDIPPRFALRRGRELKRQETQMIPQIAFRHGIMTWKKL